MFVFVCLVLYLCRDWFCGFDCQKEMVYIYVRRVWNLCLLMTEFDHLEMTLRSWQDVKIQLHSLCPLSPSKSLLCIVYITMQLSATSSILLKSNYSHSLCSLSPSKSLLCIVCMTMQLSTSSSIPSCCFVCVCLSSFVQLQVCHQDTHEDCWTRALYSVHIYAKIYISVSPTPVLWTSMHLCESPFNFFYVHCKLLFI